MKAVTTWSLYVRLSAFDSPSDDGCQTQVIYLRLSYYVLYSILVRLTELTGHYALHAVKVRT